jgi:hypothetical protein
LIPARLIRTLGVLRWVKYMKKFYLIALSLFLSLLSHNVFSPGVTASSEYETKVCEVHGVILKPDKVRVEYGHFNFNQDWLLGEEPSRLFPNAKQFLTGACKTEKDIREDGSCVRRAGPKYEEVLYCQKCRDAEKEWLKAKGMKKPYIRIGIPF